MTESQIGAPRNAGDVLGMDESQRAAYLQSMGVKNAAERKPRPERPASSERPAGDDRRESRPDRRRRNSEDGDYELPPVTSTTTSLADLFAGFKTEE